MFHLIRNAQPDLVENLALLYILSVNSHALVLQLVLFVQMHLMHVVPVG